MSNICDACKAGEHCSDERCFCQHRTQRISVPGIASGEAVWDGTGKEEV